MLTFCTMSCAMEVFACLPTYQKCMLYFRDDSWRCNWMVGLVTRMGKSYVHDLDWIFTYGLFLYSKQKFRGRLAALACICIACKQLDDGCAEIGSGDYECQIPFCTSRKLAAMERLILQDLDFRTVVHLPELECLLMVEMTSAGLVCTI